MTKSIPDCEYCDGEGWYFCGNCGDTVCQKHCANPDTQTIMRDPYRCKSCKFGGGRRHY